MILALCSVGPGLCRRSGADDTPEGAGPLDDLPRRLASWHRALLVVLALSIGLSVMKQIRDWPPSFNRSYMLRSMNLIMKSSFIQKKLGTLGKIPPKVADLLASLDEDAKIILDEGKRGAGK